MRLEEIDPNFKIETTLNEPDMEWYDPRKAPCSMHGVYYNREKSQYMRLPWAVSEKFDGGSMNHGITYCQVKTAGGRIRFRTDSKVIALYLKVPGGPPASHMSTTGKSGFDLYRRLDGEEREIYVGTFIPPVGPQELTLTINYLDGQLADYTVNMPLYDQVYEVYLGLKKDAKLEPIALPYRNEKPVVYYGSSITQGGCACRPGNAYQAMIARKYNLDYINLGFSGSAKGEPEMAEHIASLEMEAFVCDYDHNAPSLEHLQNTLPNFYRIIRQKHPDLPVIFVTKPDILLRPDGCKARRDYIFAVYEEAKARGENVYFIPGEELFAGENWDDCTVDRCHPNDLGFFRMARRIGAELKKALNL